MTSPDNLHDILFETMHQGVVYQDRAGRILAANPAAASILGIPREEILTRTSMDLARGMTQEDGTPFPTEDFPAVVALRTRKPASHAMVGYRSPDGRGMRWLSLCAIPLFHAGETRPYGVYSLAEDVTDRTLAEEQRRAQATATARFAAIAETVPGVLASTALNADFKPYVTFATSAIVELFGLTVAELADGLEPWLARIHPDDVPNVEQAIAASIASASNWHQHFRYQHPTAGLRWIEGWLLVVVEDGALTWHGFLTDVTDRENAQVALRREKAKYQGLFENSADGILVTRNDGTIVDANPAACRMHGMSVDEIRGLGRAGLVVQDTKLEAWLAQRQSTGATIGELTLRRRDGSTFPGEVQSTVVDRTRSGWNAFVVERDISARKIAETEKMRADANELARAALEKSAGELREAQRIAGVGSFTVDLATGDGYWSEEMFRIMGRDPRLGVPNLAEASEFARPQEHERVMAQTMRVFQTGEPLTTEAEVLRADGSHRHIVMRLEATRNAEGQIDGGRGTYQDVTEQRTLEEQLSKSQRLDAVGALAAGVAHDFNNLLGIIVGYAQCAIVDLPEGSALREDLSEVVAAGLRGASLTRRLLTFASRENVQPVVHRPGDVVHDMGKMLGRLIAEDISLRFFVEADAGDVYADPGQIEQVVMNLVINARDAMADGGELSVSVRSVDVTGVRAPTGVVPGPFVEITVEDTGVGMDEATQASMFDAFFTTKPSGRGTGLGLSTVQRIVRQSGGFLEVDSRVGEGTRVMVLLPRVLGAASASTPPPNAAVEIASAEGIVLLVEDDAALRSFTERLLTRGGYRVLTASSGEEAVRLVRGGATVDVLLADVVMPGMSGVEVHRSIREILGEVPVLFISGYVGDNRARQEMLADPRHFLAKPFAAEDLLAKIGQVRRRPETP